MLFLYNKIGEVMDSQIIKIAGLIVSLIAIVTPLLKLNTSITKLNMNTKLLTDKVDELTKMSFSLDKRVTVLEGRKKRGTDGV